MEELSFEDLYAVKHHLGKRWETAKKLEIAVKAITSDKPLRDKLAILCQQAPSVYSRKLPEGSELLLLTVYYSAISDLSGIKDWRIIEYFRARRAYYDPDFYNNPSVFFKHFLKEMMESGNYNEQHEWHEKGPLVPVDWDHVIQEVKNLPETYKQFSEVNDKYEKMEKEKEGKIYGDNDTRIYFRDGYWSVARLVGVVSRHTGRHIKEWEHPGRIDPPSDYSDKHVVLCNTWFRRIN